MSVSMLRDKFIELKAATEKLIEAVKKDNDESIDSLFIDRQRIINDIDKLNYNKEDFKLIAEDISLMEAFNSLQKAIEEKKNELKEKVNEIKNIKAANISYISNPNTIRNIFNITV
jgi:seryl-tRNA synthetase